MTPDFLFPALPDDLSERVRIVHDGPNNESFVLLWLHNALRVDDNPAVNVAVLTANALRQPLLVYQGLSERYPFANDRHHTFVLEGARDLAEQCERVGLPYAFHLENNRDRRPHLKTLAAKASLVITDDMPTAPARGWIDHLASTVETSLWAVDSACVVPMTMTKSAPTRAFQFRNKTKKLRTQRLPSEWVCPPLKHTLDPKDVVEFEPVDLANTDVADLIAECNIDHGVGPVPHTVGGTTAARQRWHAFRGRPLEQYAARRNNALDRDGVSRMSAYLHYGMISAFELSRDALDAGAGGEKYLDELLIWRELAYHFCHHTPDHESLNALPDWAVETLRKHQGDVRPALYDWDTLARGRTGDPLWDAAQHSLLIHGELHNNVRMTWGKAFIDWTPSPEAALRTLIDLNHRYALDGRDPASYGGLLWCLGQFDRPFSPEQPVLGVVRPRDTATHARRLPPEQFAALTRRPLVQPTPRVAVVGGGLCGLTAARTLADHGFDVTVFDRGRRVGGRLASRDTDAGSFDHGAPSFPVTNRHFLMVVDAWRDRGLVRPWNVETVTIGLDGEPQGQSSSEQYVAVPNMNALAASLVDGFAVHSDVDVTNVSEDGTLCVDGEEHSFDAVIVAMPYEQAARLIELPPGDVVSQPVHVAMLTLNVSLSVSADRLTFSEHDLVSHAVRESAKPGRSNDGRDRWTVHSTSTWSAQQLDTDRDVIAAQLRDAFCQIVAADPQTVVSTAAHRWTFGLAPENPRPSVTRGVVTVTGDWTRGATVEDAFLAGRDAAGDVLRRFLVAPDQWPTPTKARLEKTV